MNRKTFFDRIRQKPFGSLTASQVAGTEAILDEWQKRGFTDSRWLAYMLATTFHETARTMQPIAEYGRGKGRKYGVKGKHGQVAYGRGYVQLTWDFNYERADDEIGLKGALIKSYELALRPDIAAAIMFLGMAEGWFTTKKLSDYFNGEKTDWRNARRIINGLDKADAIAGYARAFYAALLAAEDGVEAPRLPDDPGPAPEAPLAPAERPVDAVAPEVEVEEAEEPISGARLLAVVLICGAVLGFLAIHFLWK